jgi:hypothetical protein
MNKPNVPHGMDPLAATDDELAAAGLPHKPKDLPSQEIWRKYLRGEGCLIRGFRKRRTKHMPTDPGTLSTDQTPGANLPVAATASNDHWSGYVVHNQVYTEAEANWVVPNVTGPAHTPLWSNAWVGVNLGSNYQYALVQGGTESDWLPGQSHFLWVEVVPDSTCGTEDPLNGNEDHCPGYSGADLAIDITAGNTAFCHVSISSNGNVGFHIGNNTPHHVVLTQLTFSPSAAGQPAIKPDGHAEWIVERPLLSGPKWPQLSNFGTVTFTGAQAVYAGHWHGVGTLSNYSYDMRDDCGTAGCDCAASPALSYPSSLSSTSLTLTWQAYGYTDVYTGAGGINCSGGPLCCPAGQGCGNSCCDLESNCVSGSCQPM